MRTKTQCGKVKMFIITFLTGFVREFESSETIFEPKQFAMDFISKIGWISLGKIMFIAFFGQELPTRMHTQLHTHLQRSINFMKCKAERNEK